MSLVRTPRLLASLGIALVVFGGCGSEREVTLAAAPAYSGALSVRIGALEARLTASGDENHYEVHWPRHRIEQTREALDRWRSVSPPAGG